MCVWRSDAAVDPGPNPLKHTHSSSKRSQRGQTKGYVWEDVQHVCDVSWRQRRGAHHIPLMCVWVCPLTQSACSLTPLVTDARYEDDSGARFPLTWGKLHLLLFSCSRIHDSLSSLRYCEQPINSCHYVSSLTGAESHDYNFWIYKMWDHPLMFFH